VKGKEWLRDCEAHGGLKIPATAILFGEKRGQDKKKHLVYKKRRRKRKRKKNS